MKILCECGEVTEFIDSEDGSHYTPDEGWYKVKSGTVIIYGEHDQVFFRCCKCGKEEWIFT